MHTSKENTNNNLHCISLYFYDLFLFRHFKSSILSPLQAWVSLCDECVGSYYLSIYCRYHICLSIGMRVGYIHFLPTSSPDVVYLSCHQRLHSYSIINRFFEDTAYAVICPIHCPFLCHPAISSGGFILPWTKTLLLQRRKKKERKKKEGGREGMRNPSARKSPLSGHVYRVSRVGEAVMQAMECWWQKHLSHCPYVTLCICCECVRLYTTSQFPRWATQYGAPSSP